MLVAASNIFAEDEMVRRYGGMEGRWGVASFDF